jgi:hypothetical protein
MGRAHCILHLSKCYLYIDLLKFQSWIFFTLAEVQNTMSSAHFWTFSVFFGFFGIYTPRKKYGRTMLTPGALVLL